MTQLGIGVILNSLLSKPSEYTDKYVGRRITDTRLEDNAFFVSFEDGTEIKIVDEGQSCCESRYMTTDDDIKSLIGGTLHHITQKEGPEEIDPEWGDAHETCFVEIQTNEGACVILTNHNEHNGYYGGFSMNIRELPKDNHT